MLACHLHPILLYSQYLNVKGITLEHPNPNENQTSTATSHTTDVNNESYTEESVFWTLFPYLVATVFITLGIVVAILKFSPLAPTGQVNIVTFDSVKYVNAQRSVLSSYIKAGPNAGPEVLNNLSARAKASIAKIAGPNTLVVLKQAVVSGEGYDITDAVLTDLGLPTKGIPTNVTVQSIMDGPITSLAQPVAPLPDKKLPGENLVGTESLP